MSTPTPPGPPGEGQQGQPGPPPGWQPPAQNQPPQWTGYDPNRYRPQDQPPDQTRAFDPNGPGGFSGPPGYQRPPQKSRAGLVIVLLIVMLVAVLGIGGVVAYNLVGSNSPSPETTEPGGLDPSDIPTEIPSEFPSYLPSDEPSDEPSDPATSVPTTLPSSGTGDLAVAKDLAQRFVAQLNANKPAAAATLGCKESKELLPTLIQLLIKPPTKLTIGEALGNLVIIVRVTGSTDGHPVDGMILVQETKGTPACVRALQVSPK